MKRIVTPLLGLFLAGMAFEASALTGEIITSPGEGEVTDMVRNSMSYFSMGGLITDISEDFGGSCQMVVAPTGDVWINSINPNFPLPNWINGKMEGNVITFQMPQAISISEGETYFLAMAESIGGGEYVMAPSSNQEFRLKKSGEKWYSDGCNENLMLSLVSANGEFVGTGGYDYELYPFTDEGAEAPSGLATETYAFINNNAGQFLNIGFDGDDVWIQGINPSDDMTWIRGTRNGDEVTFETGQYIGVLETENTPPHHCYFFPASVSGNQFQAEDELVFTFDEEKKVFTTDGNFLYNFTSDTERPYYGNVALTPRFFYQAVSDEPMVPANPYQVNVVGDAVGCYIPQVSVKGELLKADDLYYRMYVDGEIFTFYKDEYQFIDETEMQEVPYKYTEGYDFLLFDAYHEVYFYFKDYERIGFQSVYYGGSGEPTVSDIVYNDGTVVEGGSGVGEISTEEELPVSREYYDLSGKRVSGVSKGMTFRVDRFPNGETRTVKVVR